MTHARPALASSLALAVLLTGCGGPAEKAAAKPKPASTVTKLPGEGNLTEVELTPAAEVRLGLKTAEVRRAAMPRTRNIGGELLIPPGQTVLVSAPVGGTLLPPDGGVPTPGARVRRGQVVFRLLPMLAPEAKATMMTARVDAIGQVDVATKIEAQAKVLVQRAEGLAKDRLSSPAVLIDAKAAHDVAEANLKAAASRLEVLDKTIKGIEGGTLDPLPIAAQADGVVRDVHASTGQLVAPGMVLFDLVSTDTLWVRVPAYVGDVVQVRADRPAQVGGLADVIGAPTRAASPVAAPALGDPIASTVYLYYALDNRDAAYRPGQRVGVSLAMAGDDESLVVPFKAIVRDYNENAWVYEQTSPQHYSRKRVRLDRVVDDMAVLASGPAAGTKVVTDGVAEIYGAEFGGFK